MAKIIEQNKIIALMMNIISLRRFRLLFQRINLNYAILYGIILKI